MIMTSSVTLLSLPFDTLVGCLIALTPKDLIKFALVNKQCAALVEVAIREVFRHMRNLHFPLKLSSSNNFSTAQMKSLLIKLTSTQIYTIGGGFSGDQANCFLPSSNSWHGVANMTEERERCQTASVFGYIVVVSGESNNSTGSVEIYSPLDNTFANLPSLPNPVRNSAVVSMNNQVFVIGGFVGENDDCVSSVMSMDFNKLKSKSFKSFNSMSWQISREGLLAEPRYSHSAVVFNDCIWIAGGTTASDAYSTSVETLIIKDGSLYRGNQMPSMNNGRRNFKLLVIDEKLYAVGGDDQCTIECYDPSKEQWYIVTNFSNYRTNFAASTDGRSIYLFGGQNRRRGFLSTWDCFDVTLNKWSTSNSKMPQNCAAGFTHGSAITMNFENMSW